MPQSVRDEAKNRTKTNMCADLNSHDEKNSNSRRRKSPSQGDKELDNRGRKEKKYETGVSEAIKQFFK